MRKEKEKAISNIFLVCTFILLLLTGCGKETGIKTSSANVSVSVATPLENEIDTGANSKDAVAEIGATTGYGFLGGNDDMNQGGGAQLAAENGVVYFVNKVDNNYIYRMNPDGTDQRCILQEKANELNVLGGWIYYNLVGKHGLYRMKTDGSQITEIYANDVHFITVADDMVYFSEGISPGKIYFSKIDINGNRYQRLYDFSEYNVYPEVQINGNEGFLSIDKTENALKTSSQLYKVKLDGNDKRMIYAQNFIISKFIAAPEGIYLKGENNKVFLVDRNGDSDTIMQNGKSAELILDQGCEKFILVGDRIVFLSEYIGYAMMDGDISKTRISTKTDLVKDDFHYEYLYFAEGYVYYYQMNTSTAKPIELIVAKLM